MTGEAITLSRTGQSMPLVGLGLWKIPNPSCADTVYEAIKIGYRLFDGAADYGNEKEAGEGVRRAIDHGLVKREELFITSKAAIFPSIASSSLIYIQLWNTFHAHDHVKSLAKKQLELWGLDYFDLFLVHFPIALKYVDPAHRFPPGWFGDDNKVHLENTPMHETWAAMEELVDEGLAKNIGLSNCSGAIVLDALRYARIQPQVLQVERHPYLSQEPLVKLTKTLGIAMTGYSSFGPQGYIEINMDRGAKSLMETEAVLAIAEKHKKTAAQVLLRWSTQNGIAVIPKSTTTPLLTENLECNSFTLDDAEISSISSLNINLRMNDPADIDSRLGIFA